MKKMMKAVVEYYKHLINLRIPEVMFSGESGHLFIICMTLINGKDISPDDVKSDRTLKTRITVAIGEIESAGIRHMDNKNFRNLMLDDQGKVRVIDVGSWEPP